MNQYLIDQEHSAKGLIEMIYKEEIEFSEMQDQAIKMHKHYDVLNSDFTTAENSEDFSDMQIQDKFIRMAKMGESLKKVRNDIDKIEKSILEKEKSMISLSMSLLQIAKQGISTVHGDLNSCPAGKSLNSETLKNVNWQSRNQAIHSEEGNPRQPIIICFANLEKDYGSDFDITSNPIENKAKKVIDLLGWNTYENYRIDMISLLG